MRNREIAPAFSTGGSTNRRPDHALGEAILFPSSSSSTKRLPAFVRSISGGAIVLAAAYALAASAVLAAEVKPGTLVPPPPAPVAANANTEIGRMIESGPGLVVAGERLHVGLLRRFYARHDFEPVWTTRRAQADSMVNAVLRAGDHGLAPELFHASLLLSPATMTPVERDLLLSDAFLSYADALARGAMPVERRRDDEALAPEPIDVAAELDAAIRGHDPAVPIEALAPTTATYRMLRQALQSYHSGRPGADKATTNRLRAIEVNLERQRWLPRHLPEDRVWVNAADAKLVLYRDDRPVFSTRVIIGQDGEPNQTPEFEVAIEGVLFNPPWNIPESIATNEIMPKLDRDPEYLTKHRLVELPNGGLQQLPGPGAGLGQLKFEMENRFDVYLHDTPSRNLFSRDNRRISHGCIRVQKPRELAALLMQEPVDAINQEIATGDTHRSNLPTPVRAFVVYQTAFVDSDGTLQFRPDIYNRDVEIWSYLHPLQEQEPVADREPPGRRRG
jgi:murein L,D-transpeptidase YcbB/YkuD